MEATFAAPLAASWELKTRAGHTREWNKRRFLSPVGHTASTAQEAPQLSVGRQFAPLSNCPSCQFSQPAPSAQLREPQRAEIGPKVGEKSEKFKKVEKFNKPDKAEKLDERLDELDKVKTVETVEKQSDKLGQFSSGQQASVKPEDEQQQSVVHDKRLAQTLHLGPHQDGPELRASIARRELGARPEVEAAMAASSLGRQRPRDSLQRARSRVWLAFALVCVQLICDILGEWETTPQRHQLAQTDKGPFGSLSEAPLALSSALLLAASPPLWLLDKMLPFGLHFGDSKGRKMVTFAQAKGEYRRRFVSSLRAFLFTQTMSQNVESCQFGETTWHELSTEFRGQRQSQKGPSGSAFKSAFGLCFWPLLWPDRWDKPREVAALIQRVSLGEWSELKQALPPAGKCFPSCKS